MKLPGQGDVVDGRYRLVQQIGEGGFAVVYRAHDQSLGRDVAIKILVPNRDGTYAKSMGARFQRETQVLAALNDPHTVQIFGTGRTEDGALWMACELLPGMDLSALIRTRGALDEGMTIHILRQVLSSIREAHDHGVLHRDIKPGNIRVFESPDDPAFAKLMDFGIVRPISADATRITKTGGVVGTMRFMPPEQLAGLDVGPSADIYSLGIVALEMLTGERIPVEVLMGPRPLHVPASAGLAAIVNRMTAKDAAARPQTAEAVLRMLNDPAAVLPMQRSVVTRPEDYTVDPPSDRPRWYLVLAAAVGVAVLGAAFYVGLRGRAQPSTPRPQAPVERNLDGLIGPAVTVEPAPRTEVAAKPEDAGGDTTPGDGPSGCGTEHELGDVPGKSFSGLARQTWLTYVPPSYAPERPHPLILFFHGGGSSPAEGLKQTGLRRLADEMEAVLVAPSNERVFDWRGITSTQLNSIVERTKADYCIDPEAIFAVGQEVGGHAAVVASCEPWLRGLATASFRLQQLDPPCTPLRPIPMLIFSPNATRHLPIEGGNGCGASGHMSLTRYEALWRDRNACEARESTQSMPHGTCTQWTCESPLVSCVIDGGIGWPGSGPRTMDLLGCDGPVTKFDYISAIREFFERIAR